MQRFWGVILVVLGSVAFGFMGVFRRMAPETGVFMLLACRFLLAGVVLGLMAGVRRDPWPKGRPLAMLAAMGGVLYVIEAYTYFKAMETIPVGLVSLLLYTYPGVVAILARVFLKQRLSGLMMGAVGLAIAGSAITVWPELAAIFGETHEAVSPVGVGLGLLCSLGYSVYIIVGSRLPESLAPLPKGAIVCVAAGVVFSLLALGHHEALPATGRAWGGVVGLALVGSVLGITCVLAGLAHIGPVRAGIVATVEPVATILVGAMMLGEALSPVRLAGGAIILVAAIIGSVAAGSRPPPTET